MKIPQILINPPAWLAIPMCAALGAAWIGLLILLKEALH